MENNTLNNGEQLRIGILEYCDAKISRLRIYFLLLLLVPAITLFLYQIDIDTGLLFVPSFISVFASIFAIVFIFIGNAGEFGIWDYVKLNNLLKESLGYFIVMQDEKYIVIELFTPSKRLIDKGEDTQKMLTSIFRILLPQYSSKQYYVYVEFYAMPSISLRTENSIMDELERIVDSDLDNNSSNLPSDIKTKGKEMSRAYLMLYCIENTLRLFIESEEKKMHLPLTITNSVRNKIAIVSQKVCL